VAILIARIFLKHALEQCFSTCATVHTGADEKTLWCGWQIRCGWLDESGWKNPVVLL